MSKNVNVYGKNFSITMPCGETWRWKDFCVVVKMEQLVQMNVFRRKDEISIGAF